MDNYFTNNWNNENIKLLESFNAYETGMETLKDSPTIEEIKQNILDNGNIGDTEARKIYENETVFVYLSIDSCIEVLSIINKKDFPKSEHVELH